MLVINNTPCHETGCPNAKKGYYKGDEWISMGIEEDYEFDEESDYQSGPEDFE
jgi:hypothetical protein